MLKSYSSRRPGQISMRIISHELHKHQRQDMETMVATHHSFTKKAHTAKIMAGHTRFAKLKQPELFSAQTQQHFNIIVLCQLRSTATATCERMTQAYKINVCEAECFITGPTNTVLAPKFNTRQN